MLLLLVLGNVLDFPLGFSIVLILQKLCFSANRPLAFFLSCRKSRNIPELVPAREANLKCPHIVIKFYEDRLSFKGPEIEQSDK